MSKYEKVKDDIESLHSTSRSYNNHTYSSISDAQSINSIFNEKDSKFNVDDEILLERVPKEVRVAVESTDDPNESSLTFRVFILGIFWSIAVSAINQILWFKPSPIQITSIVIQLLSYFAGMFLARVIPSKIIKLPYFGVLDTNPGPYTKKEHVLITLFANAGYGGAYAIDILTIQRLYYQQRFSAGYSILLILTTQLVGYGLAGIGRKYLVYPRSMIWPANLVTCTFFNALHDSNEDNSARKRMFLYVSVGAFVWYWFPGFIIPVLGSISILCWFNTRSTVIGNLGSGREGMGILNFSLNWDDISAFVGSPLSYPVVAIVNILVGVAAVCWIVIPALYYNNVWDAKDFPIISSRSFALLNDSITGKPYVEPFNIDRVLTFERTLNQTAYEEYSPLRLTTMFAFTYGIGFAGLTCSFTHVALFYGKDIVRRFRSSLGNDDDIHNKLMKVYKEVPQWWYLTIFVVCVGLSIFTTEFWPTHMPWWAVLLSIAMASISLLPIGIIQATTNMQAGLNVITELVIGYLLPGRPIANVIFKTYGYIGMNQGLTFLGDLKLGHYMKIPPRHMFWAQFYGTIICGITNYIIMHLILTDTLHDDAANLKGPWSAPNAKTFFTASVVWGVIGPQEMFGPDSKYSSLYWFFLFGALAPLPFYLLHKRYPKFGWNNVHWPLILNGIGIMPPATPINFFTWGAVGIFFNWYLRRRHEIWWNKYNYIISAALDAGTIVGILAVTFIFYMKDGMPEMPYYWGNPSPDNPFNQEYCSISSGLLK